ncbi:sterol desaturase family protein [Spirosoma taeanense]|uniref:Sterol desaturase family protein n=1 Tax=Spirosoma taeanense TaxID=2735870 RepID=A0A6M5YCL3_9BACT|nr:sterol desaturase family protein [Spirosoma taeanense]QJW91033.1 sterol desaturase family protein [Spirosoma taeanense]
MGTITIQQWLSAIFAVGLKYALATGVAYGLFYWLWKGRFKGRKIQSKDPRAGDYKREILYSAQSIVIMATVAVLSLTVLVPVNRVYLDRHEYSLGYYLFTLVYMLVLHDTYFYWMHRFIHHPRVFRFLHLVHHRSTNPSPWAAYAFHPLEALFESAILLLITFSLPVHWSAVMLFFTFSVLHDVYIHLGYEILPANFQNTKLGRWISTSVNHNQHHKHFDGNYGLYFTFWDRMMGTLRPDYDDAYAKATRPDTSRVAALATATTRLVSDPSGGLSAPATVRAEDRARR